ncbi:Glycerol-3-phosphate/dihydroxyacetone phosphate acyltransferase [Mucor circinelloides]
MQSFAQKFTYDVALWIFNLMLDIFFREVRPRGAHKIPKEGPVIFVVAPHANQFVDPIVLMRECGRRVSFLIAEKSMHQRGIGFFARMISAIPVIRPQDLAKPGQGRIQLLNRKTDPLRIIGIDTQFTTQLKPRDSIVLPKGCGISEVDQIISDTEIIIKKEFKELRAMEILTQNDGTAYKCMPHVEQDSVYKCVHDELNNGRCITIFPEGGSHDRAEMLPLKAGVTLMALGAMAKYEGLDVKIVPCGLNYFHAHRFRSRAVIEFGNPITVSAELVQKFKSGGTAKREACSTLLDSIYNALKTVTINAGSYETLMLIQAARRLYKPAHKKLHLSQVVDLNRRFLIGYNIFREDPKVIELQQRVMAYNQLLKYHGIKDHQVSKTSNENNGRLLWLLIKRIFILTILGLWAFPGGILNLPVVIVAKVISQKKAQAALKSSTVKIAGRDVLATWKLLVGLVLLPTLYAFYSLIMFIIVLQTNLDTKWKLILPLATWSLLPFVSYASLRFGEIGHDIFKSIQPTVMALLDPKGAETLRQNREKLSSNITELINEYGPKVFPDFDANYISRTTVPPTLSPVPSRTTSTSSISWTSAPSKLPKIASGFFQQATRMNWLDDKNIFNWGRTEDSDMADDVFFFLDRFYGNISGRSRSGSVSESDSRSVSRNRSRANSISNEGFIKVEGMTSLPNNNNNIPDDYVATAAAAPVITISDHQKTPGTKPLTSRRIFRIDDVEEDEEEDDEEDHAVQKLSVSDSKKDV